MSSNEGNGDAPAAKELHLLRLRVAELEALKARHEQTEQQLRESEERFRGIYENTMIGLYRTTPDGRIIMANPALLRMLNYSSLDELRKRNLEEEGYEPGYPRSTFKQRMEAHDQVVGLESAWTTRDGTPLFIRESATTIRDDEGNIMYYEGTVEDVTERRRVEEALEASELKYRTLVENLPQRIFLKDVNFTYVSCNRNYAHDLEMSADEVAGKTDYELFPLELAEQHRAADTHIAATGEILESDDINIVAGEQRIVHVVKTPVYDEAGQIAGVLGIFWDVTEKKLAEQALRERVKELGCLYRIGRDLHGDLTTDDMCRRVVEELPGAMQFTELAVASIELDGTSFTTTGRDAAPSPGLHADITVEGRRCGRLSVYYTEDRPFLMPEEQDFLHGVAEVLSLWLERKKAQQTLTEYSRSLEQTVQERSRELQDAHEELQRSEKLSMLGQLAGGVSHELRNPLAVISNAVYYLQSTLSEANGTTKEYLELIASEVRNSERIVSDLLDFSRTRPTQREKVQIRQLVAELLERLPPPENVTVITDLPPDLPPALVDPRQITQVLANIVTNACQAMPEGGELAIVGKQTARDLRLSITDTGCGIPASAMERLFEPLFTTKPRGIGLGLPISKMLIEANDGGMEVESEEGKGTTFTLILPTGDA
jgi:PAS domain S-box-containing protein